MSLSSYWLEFLTIAGVHFLAVASPGPDFAIVLKHCVNYGRRAAILTSIGIGLGILVHVSYSLLGIGILIETTPWLFTLLSFAAATYLFFIGFQAIRSAPPTAINDNENGQTIQQSISDKKALLVGLVTNGLNPKATLFFLSVFAVVVSAQTPNVVKAGYGLYLAFATGLWFCILSYLLSARQIRKKLQQKGYIFDRIMGLVLIILAISLVVDF